MAVHHKILVVDDERFNVKLLSDILKPSYKVMAAINGEQALKAARSDNPPSLILLDVMMPEMNGYEVISQLKADEQTRSIPVIFVTALDGVDDKEKGLILGAADFIFKPVSPDAVLTTVAKHL